jgi:hypothetical protein
MFRPMTGPFPQISQRFAMAESQVTPLDGAGSIDGRQGPS